MLAFTLGYGGLRPERFIETLRSVGCKVVADVRRFPRSSTEFYTGERLKVELERVGVSYVWLGELGALGLGRRYKPLEPVECTGSPTFRAYVAYLVSEPQALTALRRICGMAFSGMAPLIMCRERRPEACHRQFIADALAAMGAQVVHVIGDRLIEHVGSPCRGYIATKLAAAESHRA